MYGMLKTFNKPMLRLTTFSCHGEIQYKNGFKVLGDAKNDLRTKKKSMYRQILVVDF